MRTILNISILTCLLVAAPRPCFALMEIAVVSPQRAKELGMEIRSRAAGSNAVRVELEFKAQGKLESFSRVDLRIGEGDKSLVTASLREERPSPDRVVVSFAADPANLDKITLRVVVQPGARTNIGYDLRVRDFVQAEKVQ